MSISGSPSAISTTDISQEDIVPIGELRTLEIRQSVMASIAAAINFYDDTGRSSNPNVPSETLDRDFLDVLEMDDGRGAIIQDFLDAFNDNEFDQFEPASVPSGLAVGGFNINNDLD